jgi:hypothetical protein
MTVVKGLAARGLTVCTTIHAPSPYISALFDRMIMLMSGRVVYNGINGGVGWGGVGWGGVGWGGVWGRGRGWGRGGGGGTGLCFPVHV